MKKSQGQAETMRLPASTTSAASRFNLKRASSAGPTRAHQSSTMTMTRDDMVISRAAGSETNRFASSFYMSLVEEGDAAVPIKLYSDRDFHLASSQITDGLSTPSDWTFRVKALLQLQGLAIGDGAAYDLQAYLRSISDLLIQQVLDLRSAISKEACRTIAVLAVQLQGLFAQQVELLLPSLMKQVAVKIAVMSSAADRCIRVVIDSLGNGGSHRLLQLFIDQYSSRSPIVRRSSLDYMCLSCALWARETVERSLTGLKQAVRGGIADADAGARKCARYLFAVLRNKSEWQAQMEKFLSEFESSAQKLVVIELQEPSSELVELLRRSSSIRSKEVMEAISPERNDGRIFQGSSKWAAARISRPSESSKRSEEAVTVDFQNVNVDSLKVAVGPARISQPSKRTSILQPPIDRSRASRCSF